MNIEFSIITKAKELFERSAFNRAEAQSRVRATEAAMRFAGQPNQEPKATFTSDSESTFDLIKLQPESIFRVRYEEGENLRIVHRWFAAGDRQDTKLPIYEIVFGAYLDNRSHARLTLTPGFYVTQIHPRQFEFPVGEAHEALGEEKHDDLFLVSRIDMMWSGIGEGVHKAGRTGSQVPQGRRGALVPVPIEV